jgi:hypothetical protein
MDRFSFPGDAKMAVELVNRAVARSVADEVDCNDSEKWSKPVSETGGTQEMVLTSSTWLISGGDTVQMESWSGRHAA